MAVHWFVATTALNRLKMGLGNVAVTPAAGTSVDGQGSAGQLIIGTSGLTPNSSTGVLATFTLSFPSFSYSGRTATLLGTPLSVVASANGTAALAELRDHSGNTIANTMTVGTSGTDFIIANTTISSGATLTCNSGTLAE
jgi:hypothetical protein